MNAHNAKMVFIYPRINAKNAINTVINAQILINARFVYKTIYGTMTHLPVY